jgi:hypothetical protein
MSEPERYFTIEVRFPDDRWRLWESGIKTIRDARERVARRKGITSGWEYRILLHEIKSTEVI